MSISQSELDKKAQKKLNIINDIYETEKVYYDSLNFLENVCLK
jgi:hypothetical protein